MEKLLTLKQVCEIVGCNDPKGRYVRNLRDKGILEAAKFGRHLMFTESSVRRFVEGEFKKQNKRASCKAPRDEIFSTHKNISSTL